jgi:hypothetical protein
LRAAAATAAQTGDTAPVDRLARSYESARAEVTRLNRALRVTNTEVAATGSAMADANRYFAEMNSHASNLGGALRTMTTRFATFTVAVAAAGVALGKLANTAAKSLDDLSDVASNAGTTTQKIEALQLVAAKAGDQSFDAMATALERTTKAMGEAQIEAAKLADPKRDFSTPFKALDIDVTRFTDPLKLMQRFAQELDKESNSAIKAALAAGVWGRGWARVLPTMSDLSAGMAQATKEIAALGGFTSQDSIAKAEKFQAALGRLAGQFTRIRDAAGAQLGAALTPALEQLSVFVGQNINQISLWIQNTAAYIKALTGDLIRFFVLGQPGQQTEWGAAIINTLLYIQQTLIPGVTTAFQTMMGFLNGVASTINSIFGTSLTGGQVGVAIAIGQISGAFNTLAIAIGAVGVVLNALTMLTPAGWLVAGMVAVSAAIVTLTGQWGALSDAVVGAVQKIGAALSWLWDKMKALGSAFANMPSLVGGATAPAGFATGGKVPGRGIGDTVPAWLTPGEYVARRASVDYYGPRIFAALNARLIPRDMFSRRGFAMGGLVGGPPMAFAGGGETSGGRPVHLHLGGHSFALSGQTGVVDALVTEAHRQRMRSAGTKPSWYGGH